MKREATVFVAAFSAGGAIHYARRSRGFFLGKH
jgi:hypothetical protein